MLITTGSFRPAIGGVSMDSCSACPAGHYCATEGLSSPTGPCAAGFYCPFDFSSTTQYAFLCPKVRVRLFGSFFLILLQYGTEFLSLSCLSHCSFCFLHKPFVQPEHVWFAIHIFIGPLLSKRLSPGVALSHGTVPTKPGVRHLHPLPAGLLLWGSHSGRTIALPTTHILPCRYIKSYMC